MVRSKIRYELIADERARRETFRKRKPGLFKKLNELKTLCDIEACAVVYNGDGTQPETWPSLDEASRVVQKFKNLPSSLQKTNMVNQEGFLMQNLARLEKNLGKESEKIESSEMELLLARCLHNLEVDVANSDDLREMLCLLERKIRMVNHKISKIETSDSTMVAGGAKVSRHDGRDEKLKQPI
ncbi:agamous-like MADS-box protein AGL80 [Primulina tabacum]|uniref:agamous-like MADS-box protein AGL80 n=1 Tax=Primulina tabacum TaxID=48773 RepID=UPI003F59106F